jgi:predicted amidohydrolase YtcJ
VAHTYHSRSTAAIIGATVLSHANVLCDAAGPRKEDLDAIEATRPVALVDQDGHALWVNSRGLALAGIGPDTPDPRGGVIERDPRTGEPSGTLRELAADLVTAKLPDYSAAEYERGILFFQRDVAGPLGITAVFDPRVTVGGPAARAYEKLAGDGRLTMFVRAALDLGPTDPLEVWLASAVAERAGHTSALFETPAVKFFADGVLEGHTAYLNESYADRPGFRGEPLWRPAELSAAFAAVDAAGFQIHVHCIGDGATSEALDALASLEATHGRGDRRPGLTHLQYVALQDVPRLAGLGVTAVVQPYWAVKDAYFFDSQLPALGKWRGEHEYPIRSFFDAGALVASASDWPVTLPPDPLDAIQIGVTRRHAGLSLVDEPLWPQECCTTEQMLDSFTINAARAQFIDAETGSLEAGKSADLVVVDRDLLSVSPDEIAEAGVLLTLFQGREVFRAASL